MNMKYRETTHHIKSLNMKYFEALEMAKLIKSIAIYTISIIVNIKLSCFMSNNLFLALNKLQMAEWITPYCVTSNQDTSWIIYIDNR